MGCSHRRTLHGSASRRRRALCGTALLAIAAPALLLRSLAAFAAAPGARAAPGDVARQTRLAGRPIAAAPTLTRLEALPGPFSSPEGEGSSAPHEFFLFIKDYGWSLRYRIGLAPESESSELDKESPLHLQWVKLKKPVRSPQELLEAESGDLFNWEKMEPAKHKGFMYHVTQVFESGVEAVINFFEGKGLKLLVKPDTGIQLLVGEEAAKKAREAPAEEGPQKVTHCWVETKGMPFLPILQSIAFYNLADVVADLPA